MIATHHKKRYIVPVSVNGAKRNIPVDATSLDSAACHAETILLAQCEPHAFIKIGRPREAECRTTRNDSLSA